ncbi:hypothetical protein X975_08124, partial [Stegodyphus mimosarum]
VLFYVWAFLLLVTQRLEVKDTSLDSQIICYREFVSVIRRLKAFKYVINISMNILNFVLFQHLRYQ